MRRAIACLLLAPACSTGEVKLPSPPWSDDRSGAFLAVRVEGDEATAIEAGHLPQAGSVRSLDLGPVADADFWMLQERCPLETLGLEEGAQHLDTTPSGPGRRLPSPVAIHVSQLRGDSVTPWTEAAPPETLQSALDRLPGAPESRHCGLSFPGLQSESFSAVLEQSLGLVSVESMTMASDGTFLVGVEFYEDLVYEDYLGFAVYRLHLDGTNRRLTALETGNPKAMDTRGEEIIIADHLGVRIGSGDGPYSTVKSYPDGCLVTGIASSPLGDARQIWIAAQTGGNGVLTRVDDARTTDVLVVPHSVPPPRSAGITVIDVDKVAAFGIVGPQTVVRWEAGRWEQEELPVLEAIAAIRWVPAVGLVALSHGGELAIDDGSGWKVVGRVETTQGRAILPHGDGVAISVCTANCAPSLWPWHPKLGFCPVLNVDARGLGQVVVSPNGEFIGAGGILQPDRVLLQRFRVTRPASTCAELP